MNKRCESGLCESGLGVLEPARVDLGPSCPTPRCPLRGEGSHIVSLGSVRRTMRETGSDMSVKYQETARGGLDLTVIER